MSAHACPTCGRKFAIITPKGAPAYPGTDASEKAIRAYYKAIAPREDLIFSRRFASPELQSEIDALLVGKPTPADAVQIRERRRIELAEAERASGAPAIGSDRWFAETGIRPIVTDDSTEEAA